MLSYCLNGLHTMNPNHYAQIGNLTFQYFTFFLNLRYQWYLGTRVQHTKTIWTQLDLRICENEGLNRFKINEKDRKSRRKFIQNTSNLLIIIHFGEILDNLQVLVSLELNLIKANRFFLQKDGVNRIVLWYKIGTQPD